MEKEKEDEERKIRENTEEARARTVATLNGNTSSDHLAPTGTTASPRVKPSSPQASPSATPLSVSSSQFTEPPPIPDGDGLRSRELSVDKPVSLSRSNTPIIEHAPLPVTPSESARLGTDQRPTHRSPSPGGSGSPSRAPSQLAQPQNAGLGLGVGPVSMGSALGVPMSKADKRRSINPAMTFNLDAANSTFAAEPRLSPLPPSPLRASFTESRKSDEISSPTSARFNQVRVGTPTRSASQDRELPSIPRPLIETPSQDKKSTPQLNDLPSMSFSLSDPDFALILSTIDQSPEKPTPTPATARPMDKAGADGDDGSSPSWPQGDADSPSMSRSPGLDLLSTSTDHLSSSSTPQRRQLSPSGAGSTPHLLRTRQTSAESTMSLSRLGADSSFATIVETVAAAKHGGQENVQVDLTVLSGVISEVEELKDALTALKNKYTGVKVSATRRDCADGVAEQPAI